MIAGVRTFGAVLRVRLLQTNPAAARDVDSAAAARVDVRPEEHTAVNVNVGVSVSVHAAMYSFSSIELWV